MAVELFPIQREAVETIRAAFETNPHKGFILADGCGLGKTAIALETAKRTPGAKLIFCPAYLLYNWSSECSLWGIPESSVCVIDAKDQIIEDKEFYIMPYSRVRVETYTTPVSGEEKKRPNALLRQLFKKQFSLIIADEAHALAGWNTQQSRYIVGTLQNKNLTFLSRADRMLLLTGTPFKNNIIEIYNIVIRIAPGVLDHMSKYEFFQRYAGFIEYSPFGVKPHGIKNEADLKKRLSPIMLRRTKIDGLAKLNDEIIRLDPRSNKLKKLFEEEEKFLAAHGIAPEDVEGITKITKTDVSQIAEVRTQVALCKIPAALELLETIRDEQEEPAPVTIYCYHRATLAALKSAISAKYPKLRTAYIDGSVSAKDRHEIVTKQFQAGKLDVLCSTIGALREGANLTAGRDVIFVELAFVPADLAQAIGRFHRRGQVGAVHVRRLVFDAGIEKRILRILAEKSTTIEKIMGK